MDTVMWSIFNTGPATSLRDLKVGEAKVRIGKECCIRPPPGHQGLGPLCQAPEAGSVEAKRRGLQGLHLPCPRSAQQVARLPLDPQPPIVNSLLELFKKETDAIADCNSGSGGNEESHRLMLLWIIELLGKVAQWMHVISASPLFTRA